MSSRPEEVAPALEEQGLDEAALAEPGRASILGAFSYRDFRLYWIGLTVSNVGGWMQQFALGWLVVQLAIRDGAPQLAPLYIGIAGLSRAIPGLAFGLFGGVAADRADRRRLLLVTQLAAGTIAGLLAVLTATDRINIVEIVLIQALFSITFAFDAPTRQAMLPTLVGERDLVSAIGLYSATFNAATLIGPLIGGLLIGFIGPGGLFALNSLSFLAIVVALRAMTPREVQMRSRQGSVLESLAEGLSYVRRDPLVRWLVLLSVTAALFARPYIQLLPAVAQRLGVGAVELSWLLAAAGVGSLCGAVATASLGAIRRRGRVLLLGLFALGILLVGFSLQRSLVADLVFLVAIGFATMLYLGMSTTLMQTSTPDRLRGRVMSVQTMVFQSVMPGGQMALGTLGTFVGIDRALLVGGIIVVAVVVFALVRVPQLRAEIGAANSRPQGASA